MFGNSSRDSFDHFFKDSSRNCFSYSLKKFYQENHLDIFFGNSKYLPPKISQRFFFSKSWKIGSEFSPRISPEVFFIIFPEILRVIRSGIFRRIHIKKHPRMSYKNSTDFFRNSSHFLRKFLWKIFQYCTINIFRNYLRNSFMKSFQFFFFQK